MADPGCYSATTLLTLAPLVAAGLIEPEAIVVDAKSGVSGAGRGGGSTFGYADTNEDLVPYRLLHHDHVPEIQEALSRLAEGRTEGWTGDREDRRHADDDRVLAAPDADDPGLLAAPADGRPTRPLTTADVMAGGAFYAGLRRSCGWWRRARGRDSHPVDGGLNLAFVSYLVNRRPGWWWPSGRPTIWGRAPPGRRCRTPT